MSILIYIKESEWDKEMHTKCECGHELYLHGFVQTFPIYPIPEGNICLRTSQCIMCGYDEETHKFLCEGFIREK